MIAVQKWIGISLVAFLLVLPATFAGADGANQVELGKNPGQTKGRWLRVDDVAKLKGYEKVALGEVTATIHWKKKENESPIDEKLLADKLKEYLVEDLKESGLFTEVSAGPLSGAGVLRLDCDVEVEPGSRATRYFVGMGAGKSKSITEIHLRDHGSGEEIGLYHGYGTGTGMGFKVAGGGARKMTQDDVQENSKKFVELLRDAR